jgi:hypothetical protein
MWWILPLVIGGIVLAIALLLLCVVQCVRNCVEDRPESIWRDRWVWVQMSKSSEPGV